ncbi:hypothetical protein DFH06DRAFT_1207870 [Mycena polygramma]|nr:hypothetical protein DFH06DRAFT_1207870 [Mycena polygramma]
MARTPPAVIAILDSPDATQSILEAILESPNGRRSLSRLARTCRAWLDPALNVLWRELDSLAPIIGLFPPHLLKKTRRPGLGLSAPPQEKDWDKILKYGERVLRITYDELPNNISTSIFPIFEELRPRTYLLPNLQTLTWRIMSQDMLDRAALFLTSGLQGFTLHLGGGGTKFPTLPTFLADLGSRVKHLYPQDSLERLAIIAPGALSPTIGKWAASLPGLKSLQLDLTGRPLVAVNGFFRDLRSGASTPDSVESHTDSGVFSADELDFSEIRKSMLRLTGDAKKATVFPALTQLQLTGQASSIVAFLTHLSNPLTQLDITIEDPPDAVDWQDLSQMICQRFGSSLTSLRIGATLSSKFSDLVRSTSRAAAAPAPSRLSLEHLSSLPALRTISIDLPESICFTPADIARLADVAPNLEEVRLCPLARFSQTSPPQLTLESLAPLVKNCRKLGALWVVIQAKGGSAEPLATSDSLAWLHVGHSWVSDTLQVAILLSHLAPHLETIKWFTERNRPGFVEANARSWQKVSDILPHLQNLRLTERRAAIPQKEVVIEYVQVEAPRPPMSDKGVDATVPTVDCGVEARPFMAERSVQAMPSTRDRETQAMPTTKDCEMQTTPSCASIAIDATPKTVEAQVDATPEPSDAVISSVAVQAPDSEELRPEPHHSLASSVALVSLSSALSLLGFMCRIFISYPLSLPLRMFHASFAFLRSRVEAGQPSNGADVPLDTLNVRP